MYEGSTVFSQLMSLISHVDFDRCVRRYDGNNGVRRFSCWDQFLAMSFAQLTYRESLRDIEVCLRAQQKKLYHSGFRGAPKRSTLAEANEHRDWRMYQDMALRLIEIARPLCLDDDIGVRLRGAAYAFDSTMIDLCLSLFPWAQFTGTTSSVKMHTLLDLRGSIPTFVCITKASVSDVAGLDTLPVEPGSIIVMDRGYVDYQRLYRLEQRRAFFLIRARDNLVYQRRSSRPVTKSTGARSDQTIRLTGAKSKDYYPIPMRRVSYYAADLQKHFVYLTNNFEIAAEDVAALYRRRWHVELFFKWIKQHLRIKKFFGTSENSVKTQIWIAIATYVLVIILKKRLNLPQSLYTILQVLSVSLFEKQPILSLFQEDSTNVAEEKNPNQLSLLML